MVHRRALDVSHRLAEVGQGRVDEARSHRQGHLAHRHLGQVGDEVVALLRERGLPICRYHAGGDMVFGPPSRPLPLSEGTDMASAEDRLEHVADCLPEICTLDCGTMNFAEADYVMMNTPGMLRAMAKLMQDYGVRVEVEAFETGHLWFAKQLVEEGLIDNPVMVQLCMGIPYGAEGTTANMVAMHQALPPGVTWGAFGIGRQEMPMVAQSVIMGGNARVGLEDNIYLEKGVLADNAGLVTRAREIVERLGARLLNAEQARRKLNLT